MALISLRQLLDHAAENGYGMPAFNVNNMEQVHAIMQAADETNSPVILQGSAGARSYAGEPFLRHLISAAIEMYPHIPLVMHQDHGSEPAVCLRSIQSGFSSVMMDGSLMADMKTPASYEYNVDVTKEVVINYFNNLHPSKQMFVLNYDVRKNYLEGEKHKLMAKETT